MWSLLRRLRLVSAAALDHPEWADVYGLVAVGGDLTPERLLRAYRHGIFPWFGPDEPICWWSPDPRAIFEFDRFRVSRRLLRTCRGGRFKVTCNRDFAGVIAGCATAGERAHNTWLTPKMIEAYTRLHELGHAHSVEVWCDGQLAGGTYGVTVGGLYAGESMFYRVRDASKVALVHLMGHLRARGYSLFDIQQRTAHTARLGATEISRQDYLARLADAVPRPVSFGSCLEGFE
jgi:leucyl/phenylalanyl-tRNA--protein transferase